MWELITYKLNPSLFESHCNFKAQLGLLYEMAFKLDEVYEKRLSIY